MLPRVIPQSCAELLAFDRSNEFYKRPFVEFIHWLLILLGRRTYVINIDNVK